MFNNLTVKTRLFLLISLLSFISLALSALGLYGMSKSNAGLNTVYADRVVPLKDLKIIADMYAVNIVDTTHKTRNGNISWEEATKNVNDAERIVKEKWDAYLSTILVAEEKKLVAEIKPLFASTQIKIDKLQSILERNDESALIDFSINELYPSIDPISTKFSELIEVQLVVAKAEYDAAQKTYQIIFVISIVSLIIGIGSAGFIGYLIVRQLMTSLETTQKVCNAIANGNLNSSIDVSSEDELGVMLRSMKTMQDNLAKLTQEIQNVMTSTANGDFSKKIVLSDKKGFGRDISESVNKLSDTLNISMNDTMRVANALAVGDLSQKVTTKCQGVFEQVKDSVNHTVDELRKLVEEVENIVYSGAECGDFSVKMSMYGKIGYGKRLAELINQLFETTEKSLNDVMRVANSLAEGDLTQQIRDDYVGVFASVKTGMNTSVENLKSLIGEVKATSEVIASASNEISAGNHNLSHRTEEQAASLEETAASMEQLAATVQANTENAKHANALAVDASKTASKGVEVVNNVVSTMVSINEASHRIVDIVSVIDDIAFQTNILALNAAVEAARAGEQGKGFAVVAVEVRNLAQRAANAAGEVKQLIGESVERINNGSKQVTQAGKTMEDIVGAIQEVSTIVSGITAASIEQNAGIDQVHEAVVQMDGITQQNAALVEEAAAAAESLSQQTQSLAAEMAHFKT